MHPENLHEFLLNTVRAEVLQYAYIEGDEPTDLNLLRIIFKNYRHTSNNRRGLRLTYLGNRVMRKHFTSYSYENSEITSNKAILGLDKNMLWPYYISNKLVTFYNQDDAAWFKLNGSDINTYTNYL